MNAMELETSLTPNFLTDYKKFPFFNNLPSYVQRPLAIVGSVGYSESAESNKWRHSPAPQLSFISVVEVEENFLVRHNHNLCSFGVRVSPLKTLPVDDTFTNVCHRHIGRVLSKWRYWKVYTGCPNFTPHSKYINLH